MRPKPSPFTADVTPGLLDCIVTLGLTAEQQELGDAVGQFAARHAPSPRRGTTSKPLPQGSYHRGGMLWSPTAFMRFICRSSSAAKVGG